MPEQTPDPADLLALLDRHQRIGLKERGARRETTGEVVRQVHESGGSGQVVHSRLTEANADRVIREQVAVYRALGQDFEWKLYGHDTPADLGERLLAQGFVPQAPESVMVLDLRDAPEALSHPVGDHVRRVTDPACLEAIGAIHRDVWGDVEGAELEARTAQYLAGLRADLEQDPDCQSIYFAYAGDLPVAYARITFQAGDPFAGLWGGSTLPAFRGRGFYTELLAARLQEARHRGVRYLTLDASPMSRPIVERHGFRCITTTRPYLWHAPRP